MIVKRYGDTWYFKAGVKRTTEFCFLLSDFSAFGNPVKKPMNIRKNYREVMKILLEHEINELIITLKNSDEADHFEIRSSDFYRGRTVAEVKEYRKMDKTTTIKAEAPKLEIEICLPANSAVKVFSIKDGFKTYLVNDGENFGRHNNYKEVVEITGVYF